MLGVFRTALIVLPLLLAPGLALAEMAANIEAELDKRLDRTPSQVRAETLLLVGDFYLERAHAPAWISDRGPTDKARALARVFETEAFAQGLNPRDYEAERIKRLLEENDPDTWGELEVALSVNVVRYGVDLGSGRIDPRQHDPEHYAYARDVDEAMLLRQAASALDVEAYLLGHEPQRREYVRLKETLETYRAHVALGGWTPIDDGETLDPGMQGPRVQQVRDRLRVTGLYTAEDEIRDGEVAEGIYGPGLEEAVKRFQFRYGIAVDGRVGKNTRAEMNVPAAARVRQILLNMERRRWMDDDLGERYVFVNLADFVLKYVEEPKTLFDARVVVGETYHRTPVFSSEMTYIVINPTWNVPTSIAARSIVPKTKQDLGYIEANDFTIYSDWGNNAPQLQPASIDWTRPTAELARYRFVQGPGDGNALGRIKFMFPNDHSVYIHDTPSKNLFEHASRAFSSGCVRVQEPQEFASFVLGSQPDWTRERIAAAIASGETRIVRLDKPLKVHITYLTAFTNKDGSVHFRPDIYGRDEILAHALFPEG